MQFLKIIFANIPSTTTLLSYSLNTGLIKPWDYKKHKANKMQRVHTAQTPSSQKSSCFVS